MGCMPSSVSDFVRSLPKQNGAAILAERGSRKCRAGSPNPAVRPERRRHVKLSPLAGLGTAMPPYTFSRLKHRSDGRQAAEIVGPRQRSKLFPGSGNHHRSPPNGGSHLLRNPWAEPAGSCAHNAAAAQGGSSIRCCGPKSIRKFCTQERVQLKSVARMNFLSRSVSTT